MGKNGGLTLVRAANLSQYRLDPLPSFRLLAIACFSKRGRLLSRFRDGSGALG